MFYVKELFYRLQYLLISFFVLFVLFYSYKNLLFLGITSSILTKTKKIGFDSFIYTHPAELLNIYFNLIFLFSLICLMPYILWQILDFLKSSLYKHEYKKMCKNLFFLFCYLITTNVCCFFFLFPSIWNFVGNFNESAKKFDEVLKIFFEPKMQEYFNFILDFLYVINASIIFFLTILILISFCGLKKIIYWKKLFIFINIMFATLLSPPDVYSQLFILMFLTILFESAILILFGSFKISKLGD
jgi:sec-independent protein translocase protein TatC